MKPCRSTMITMGMASTYPWSKEDMVSEKDVRARIELLKQAKVEQDAGAVYRYMSPMPRNSREVFPKVEVDITDTSAEIAALVKKHSKDS